jgi:hypothetical protein
MKCNLCNSDIVDPLESSTNTRNIAVKVDDKYLCLGCSEVSFFMSDLSKPSEDIKKVIPISEPKVKKNTNIYECIKCKSRYEGIKCGNCQMPNPLFNRSNKKSKRKK